MTGQQVERLLGAVDRIAAALEMLAAPPHDAGESAPCAHPPEAVVSFGETNGRPDWLCKACGFRSVED